MPRPPKRAATQAPAEAATGGKRRGGAAKPPHGKPGEKKPGDKAPSSIAQLAKQHWAPGAPGAGALDEAVLAKVYARCLNVHERNRRARSNDQTELEVSGYLERYLWPHFDAASASCAHVLSIAAMVALKFREGVPAWSCFHAEPARFEAFFARLLGLPAARPEMTVAERTCVVHFLVHAYQSLEDAMVRAQVLRLASLPMWFTISPTLCAQHLAEQPQLARPWKTLQKRKAKEAKAEGGPPPFAKHEREFLPSLLAEFRRALAAAEAEVAANGADHGDDADADDDDDADAEGAAAEAGAPAAAGELRGGGVVLYLERLLELFIDLMAQLPTRRFFHAVLLDSHALAHAALSPFASSPRAALFNQLLKLLVYYERFEVDDHKGTPIADADAKAAASERLQALQRVAFKMGGALVPFSLSNLSSIDTPAALAAHLGRLTQQELVEIAGEVGLLHDAAQGEALGGPFLLRLLVDKYERRAAQHEAIGSLPLYPDEVSPWDTSVVPAAESAGETPLALPKLNLQFLTLADYLLRNFTLFRLEATHEIKQDIEDVVTRLQPRPKGNGATAFKGWARMALPIGEFRLFKVGKPFLGEARPSEVRAEATVSLQGCRPEVAHEWSSIKRHDVVFLLTVRAPAGASDANVPFPERCGLCCVRGAEVTQVVDEEGHVFTGESENDQQLKGHTRKLELQLDTAQYHLDAQAMAEGRAEDVHQTFNVLMRRKPKENNFKAILDSIRALMTTPLVVPDWLQDVLLGYGDPSAASYWNLPAERRVEHYDFFDTFLDMDHVRASFGHAKVEVAPGTSPDAPPPYRLTIPAAVGRANDASANSADESAEKPTVTVEAYDALVAGPYPEDAPRMNPIRFTPVQVEALRAAMNPGLTLVVGPPGTGKTDTAVQIVSNIAHTFSSQRTLIITHSNQALNDVFEKLMVRDIDERYMLRLGHGEELLETEKDFSRHGRVNHMLRRRLELLVKVERLGKTLDVTADVGYTCETAQYFYLSAVLSRWESFEAEMAKRSKASSDERAKAVGEFFPFAEFFADAPQPLFRGDDVEKDMEVARSCFRHIQAIFTEVEECRAFELLRSSYDRGNFLLTKHAKVIAMTCTHAAIKRRDLINLAFQYDNLVMEEAAQIMEIETFIPMVLQNPDAATGASRLKRVILIGDHHQLPPVVKNTAFQKYSRLDQSLFARFVRIGVPAVQLDQQGRARKEMADLYRWRYDALGDLPAINAERRFQLGVPGFAHTFQLVDVEDPQGVGESVPHPHYIQNLSEAEFVVATFMYMRLRGIPASKISIITTYNGQKDLIGDVVAQRCAWSPLFGTPAKIATTDKFQGQQNDYVLLSLVRTRSVGHIRDVRRLVVSMSRARLGLYVFCRRELFEHTVELAPTFRQLLARPAKLQLLPNEQARDFSRSSSSATAADGVVEVDGLVEMGELVARQAAEAESRRDADGEMPEAPPAVEMPDAPPDDDD